MTLIVLSIAAAWLTFGVGLGLASLMIDDGDEKVNKGLRFIICVAMAPYILIGNILADCFGREKKEAVEIDKSEPKRTEPLINRDPQTTNLQEAIDRSSLTTGLVTVGGGGTLSSGSISGTSLGATFENQYTTASGRTITTYSPAVEEQITTVQDQLTQSLDSYVGQTLTNTVITGTTSSSLLVNWDDFSSWGGAMGYTPKEATPDKKEEESKENVDLSARPIRMHHEDT